MPIISLLISIFFSRYLILSRIPVYPIVKKSFFTNKKRIKKNVAHEQYNYKEDLKAKHIY